MRAADRGESRLRKWARRRRNRLVEAVLMVRVAFWLLLVSLACRTLGMPRTLRWLAPRRLQPRAAGQLALARKVGRHADRLMHYWPFGPEPICWKRALVMFRLVPAARPGQVRVIIGVAADQRDLRGHAWLELDDVAVDGTAPGSYRTLIAWPPLAP